MAAKGRMMMNSITSGGGRWSVWNLRWPNLWLGVSGSKTPSGVENTFANDYDRACDVRDYLGSVPLGDRSALILGDMPLETLIWKPKNELPRIVRVYYADPDANMIEILESSNIIYFNNSDEILSVEFKSSSIVIFDSAYPGVDAGISRLSFNIPKGKYLALTKRLDPMIEHLFLFMDSVRPNDPLGQTRSPQPHKADGRGARRHRL